MSQHDMHIANADGATVRADLNSALQALVSRSSGASAPSTTYAYMTWVDTTTGTLKRRNAANSAWIVDGTIDESLVLSRSSNTMLGVSDRGKTIRATSTFTQTFDAAATLGDGWYVNYINEGTGTITFDPNGSETIAGATTLTLGPGESCVIVCNGTNFQVGMVGQMQTARCDGRLTLTSGTPVTTSDVTGATTVYFTPYKGNKVSLYDGVRWTERTFSELSQATTDATKSPAAVAADSVYDVFVWNDSGTLRATRGPAWSSATARGTGSGTTELELFEGRLVNKHAITNGPAARRGLYVGSIASDASSQIVDSMAKRFVWNAYNRVLRVLRAALETTDSWTYTTASFRHANGNPANQLEVVRGLDEDAITALACASATNSSAGVNLLTGIGLDSATSLASGCVTSDISVNVAGHRHHMTAHYRGLIGIGRHFLTWLEYSQEIGTTTWYGDRGFPSLIQMGIQGEMLA